MANPGRVPSSQALEKPSALLDETIETTAQGVVVFDAHGRLVTFNRQFAELFEFPPDFLQPGMPIVEIIRSRAERGMYGEGDPEDLVKMHLGRSKLRVERSEERTLASGTVYVYHHKPMADGGFVTTYTDITERKRAEWEAEAKSQLLETTFQNMIQGIAVFDHNHSLVAFNPQFVKILDLPPDFLQLGMTRREIIRFRTERGDYQREDAQEIISENYEDSNFKEKRVAERMLSNGTVYDYHRQPLPGGGYVVTYTDITERKEMEHRLRQSEEKFRGAFDNAGVGIVIRSADGKSREYNRALCDMLGYSADELRPINLRELAHPGDDPKTTSIRYLSFGDMDTQTIQRRYIRKDGKMIWCSINYKSVYDAEGKPHSTIAMYQEITERKRAEQEAAEKSRLLETTINSMAQGFVYYDAELRLVAFNAQYEAMFDYPPGFLRPGLELEEVIRHRGAEWLGSKRTSREDRIKAHIARASLPVERARERRLNNGRSYIYHRKPLTDGGFITTYTDITDHKRAEQELAEKSQLLEATFQNMVQGIAVFGASHDLVAFNPQFAEILGLPPDFLYTGMSRVDIIRFVGQDKHYSEAQLEAVIEAKLANANTPERNESTTADGRTYSYERTPMPGGGYISTLTDITEQREAEKQLQQAQKMEAVGQLTGGIAHDFNNLLAVSMGNVELAEEVALSGGDVQPFLSTVKRASERGASLTNQLLAFSRSQTLFPEVLNAGELVESVTDLLRRSLGETIEIRVTSQEGLWPCEVDPHHLESAILNLAINARDAMPNGGTLSLRISNISLDDDYAAAQTDVSPGEYVLVEVSDTGSGMPQDVIDHAFDPFFTTKEVGRGSGLGLSMVYGFVKQSGGHVSIYSKEGKGTTIRLYLPRSGASDTQATRAEQIEVPESLGETVLVVEDDPDVRTLSVALLSSLGYEIREAADGESALMALETTPRIDLLFTDVVLPGGMSGPELAAIVQDRVPGIAVLYTSGYPEPADPDKSTIREEVALLQKPYRKADLARKVRLALDRAKA